MGRLSDSLEHFQYYLFQTTPDPKAPTVPGSLINYLLIFEAYKSQPLSLFNRVS